MGRLELWARGVAAHLQHHWKHHLIPLGLFLGGMVVMGWTLLLFYALIFGLTMLFLALEMEVLSMLSFFGFAALGSLTMLLFHGAGALLVVGYTRLVLRAQQGHEVTWKELLWGLRNPVRSVVLLFLLFLLLFASAGMFYLPLIFLGGWMALSLPSLVQGDRGALGAMGRAWGVSGRVYGPLLVLVLGFGFLSMFLVFFPIIGPALVLCACVTSAVVIYDDVTRSGA